MLLFSYLPLLVHPVIFWVESLNFCYWKLARNKNILALNQDFIFPQMLLVKYVWCKGLLPMCFMYGISYKWHPLPCQVAIVRWISQYDVHVWLVFWCHVWRPVYLTSTMNPIIFGVVSQLSDSDLWQHLVIPWSKAETHKGPASIQILVPYIHVDHRRKKWS